MKRIAVIVFVALVSARCGRSLDTPTTPTTTAATSRTAHFGGSLTVGETRFYSFTITQAGTITAMLASITSPRTGAALDTELGLGIGRPAGTGCALSASVNTTAALKAHLQESAAAGIYCINVSDVGRLTGDVDFVVRFTYP